MGFSKIGTVLVNDSGRHESSEILNASYIVSVAKTVIESYFNNLSESDVVVRYYKVSKIYISASSSIISSDIRLRERDILKQINNKLEKNCVKGIKFI